MIDKIDQALNDRGRPVRGAACCVLGIAYKRDIDDPRESPAFELLELLLEHGAKVSYHDPTHPDRTEHAQLAGAAAHGVCGADPEVLRAADAVLIATDHSAVDYETLARTAQLIIDTRGVYRDRRPNVVKA